MKLTTKGQYAVMAMVDLANEGGEGPVSIADVAGRQGISQTYLEQLFNKMRRAGLVDSVRGPGGGYTLAASPGRISIADIMFAVDEPLRTMRCEGHPGIGCDCRGPCQTHDLWDALGAHIVSFLSSVTLHDVIAGDPHAFVSPGHGCRALLGDRAGLEADRPTLIAVEG